MCALNSNRVLDPDNYSHADAIVIAYPSLLLIVHVTGIFETFAYDSVPFLIPEMDCVRILSVAQEHEFLQKVPKSVNNVFAINSKEPSSYLFGAYQKYEVKEMRMLFYCFFFYFVILCDVFIDFFNIRTGQES